MKLSRKNWNSYVTRLSAINKTAGKKMQAWIDKYGTDNVQALVEYAYALTTSYGEAASAAACQMYDEVAAIQNAHVPPAEPKPTQHINYVDKAIRSTLDRAPSTVPSTVSEMVKRTGAETTLKNAQRDGAYFAWVPDGDTCAFCITLASNGWRRASKKTINGDHAEHIHKNCNCEFAISFNGPGQIEGYDPEALRAQYDAAEGDNWQEKMNSMRRAQYAANPEKIRAKKRAAYAVRMLKNHRENGILDIEIDELVACLRDTKTGELVDTEAFEITNKSLLKQFNEANGWNVNWYKLSKDNVIYAIRVKGGEDIQGLIAFHYDEGAKGMYLNWASAAPWNVKQHTGGEQKYTGVGGHLFAIAAEKTLEKDPAGGWMYGFAKNEQLLKYYVEKLGAEHLPVQHPFQIIIDTPALRKLLETYNYEWIE